jgi:hypothetical protein
MNQSDAILIKTQECCADLIKSISKIQQHGITKYNIEKLERNYGNLLTQFMLLVDAGIIALTDIEKYIESDNEQSNQKNHN